VDVNEAWEQTLSQWQTRLFIDSPQCKSVFANGMAFVMKEWERDDSYRNHQRVYRQMIAFVEAYMSEAERLNGPQRNGTSVRPLQIEGEQEAGDQRQQGRRRRVARKRDGGAV